MPNTYQDIYPSPPLLRSKEVVCPSAAALLSLEYFETEPDSMPTQVFDQHHILLNLKSKPHRVENWRNGEHRDFTYHKNEIIVTPAGVKSGWRWHAKSKVIVITIDPVRFERFAQCELNLSLAGKQLKDIPQYMDEDITRAGLLLLDALQSESSDSLVMYDSSARFFLIRLIQKYGLYLDENFEFSQSFSPGQYKRVLEYVAANFGKNITLEEMATQAGISPYHFSRLFKKTTGRPPHQFVMSYRVEQAKRLLTDPYRPLIDIALSCGFSDQAHFSRIFKKIEGQTPKLWRKAQ